MYELPEGHTYKKQMTSAEGDYVIVYIWPQGQKIVSETKPTYVEWLAEGNTPDVIPYVPPTPPAPQPDWDLFRDGLVGSRFYSLMISTPVPSILSAQLVDALRQCNLGYLRTVVVYLAGILELETADKIEVNEMAEDLNIDWIFEVV